MRRTQPPKYPDAAVRGHIEGNVVLNVHVDASGKPTGADVVSVIPTTATELASASATAVLQWRFSPVIETAPGKSWHDAIAEQSLAPQRITHVSLPKPIGHLAQRRSSDH